MVKSYTAAESAAIVVDNYERACTSALRTLQPLSPMLTDALHALENGRLDVVREFLERTQNGIDDAVKAIRER